MKARRHRFQAEIKEGRGGGAFVVVPLDVAEAFETRGRVPVKAQFDGEPYRGSIAPMGGRHVLGLTREIREAIGKTVGDMVHVVLERDDAPRVVDVPDDLAAALGKKPAAKTIFERLSYTHCKEYVRWIEEAKRPETRERRIRQTIEMLMKTPGT